MQPFNQQLPFRYFDSDMAKKRPLVVSFRRIQKMTPNNLENCGSVSICDIHRIDTKSRDNNDAMSMKVLTKYGAYPSKMTMQKKYCCSQSCRNCFFNGKQKSQLDSLFDENVYDSHHLDKGVFPKEKFHGNAKLLLTMNDDILQKAMTDCDSHEEYSDMNRQQSNRKFSTTYSYKTKEEKNRYKYKPAFKFDVDQNKVRTITSIATDKMIDGYERTQYRFEEMNYPLSRRDDDQYVNMMIATRNKKTLKKRLGYETPEKLKKNMKKSSSAPTVYPLKKLSLCLEREENAEALERIQKSVSMLSVNGK